MDFFDDTLINTPAFIGGDAAVAGITSRIINNINPIATMT
jgi:hypothetical protein